MTDHIRARVVVSGDIVEIFEYSNGIPVGGSRGHKIERKGPDEGEKRSDNLYRARQNIRRLVWSNISGEFTKMLTLTYAVTTLDVKQVKTDIKIFIKQMRRYGYKMRYLYVLEHQKERGFKEGNAGCLHVHMFLFDNEKIKLEHLNKSWGRGQTHIKVLRDICNSGAYACKYITKENLATYGQHCYGCSRGLVRPDQERFYEEGYTDGLIDGVQLRYIKDALNIHYNSSFRHDFKNDLGEGCSQTVKYFQGKWKGDNFLKLFSKDGFEVEIDETNAPTAVDAVFGAI